MLFYRVLGAIGESLRNGGFLLDFLLYRLSFKPTNDLFAKPLTREEWLRSILSEQFDFKHRTQEFSFVPVPEEERANVPAQYILGWIAKQAVAQERAAPEEGLAPTEHRFWRAAFIMLDPTSHEDGQKLVVEDGSGVGRASSIANSLVAAINGKDGAPFEGVVHPILEPGSFWRFVDQKNNRIKSISFTLAAPNMFGGKDDLQEELRQLREQENVSQVKATLTSDTTLNARTQRMKEVVDYTEKGAGKLTARAEDGTPYSSEAHVAKRSLNVEPHSRGRVAEFIRQIGTLLDRLF